MTRSHWTAQQHQDITPDSESVRDDDQQDRAAAARASAGLLSREFGVQMKPAETPTDQQRAQRLSAVQARSEFGMSGDQESTLTTAASGVAGSGQPLPHLDRIQASFGGHDVSNVQAHVGGPASDACDTMNATAYATGDQTAFKAAPDLHTAAHEAAHVVQQRSGVHLKGGVGQAGDAYEHQADAVADKVVRGESAEALLGDVAERAESGDYLQRKPGAERSPDSPGLYENTAARNVLDSGPCDGTAANNEDCSLTEGQRATLRGQINTRIIYAVINFTSAVTEAQINDATFKDESFWFTALDIFFSVAGAKGLASAGRAMIEGVLNQLGSRSSDKLYWLALKALDNDVGGAIGTQASTSAKTWVTGQLSDKPDKGSFMTALKSRSTVWADDLSLSVLGRTDPEMLALYAQMDPRLHSVEKYKAVVADLVSSYSSQVLRIDKEGVEAAYIVGGDGTKRLAQVEKDIMTFSFVRWIEPQYEASAISVQVQDSGNVATIDLRNPQWRLSDPSTQAEFMTWAKSTGLEDIGINPKMGATKGTTPWYRPG